METMKVTMLLADYAQVADGKLNIIGGGWSVTGPDPTVFGLAILIHVPWSEANAKHKWEIALFDGDGQPATVPLPNDERQEIRMGGEFEVGRPAGLIVGSVLEVPLAVNLGPLPLAPASRYVWRLTLDGQEDENWQVRFSTRPANIRLAG